MRGQESEPAEMEISAGSHLVLPSDSAVPSEKSISVRVGRVLQPRDGALTDLQENTVHLSIADARRLADWLRAEAEGIEEFWRTLG